MQAAGTGGAGSAGNAGPAGCAGRAGSTVSTVSIDLNADLGENEPGRIVSDDAAMLSIVTSANVSCGLHAGEPAGIRDTIERAVRGGITIGAHPGYRDREGFGRRAMRPQPAQLRADVEYQLGALMALTASAGGQLRYVKPHGALYNAIHDDEAQARAVVEAVRSLDDRLTLLGQPGAIVLRLAEAAGLRTAREAFADRAYQPDGSLVPRGQPGAVLHEPGAIAQRALRMVEDGAIGAIDGTRIPLPADSLCVHGDSPGAIQIAARLRAELTAAGVTLRPFAESERA